MTMTADELRDHLRARAAIFLTDPVPETRDFGESLVELIVEAYDFGGYDEARKHLDMVRAEMRRRINRRAEEGSR